jgi:hypothetical protein
LIVLVATIGGSQDYADGVAGEAEARSKLILEVAPVGEVEQIHVVHE